MTLVDWQIQWRCNDFSWQPNSVKSWLFKQAAFPKLSMIKPYNPDQVNAASYDVLLGDRIKVAMLGNQWKTIELDGFPYQLIQGEFILAETVETFYIPRNVSAQFALKSSRGREGYEHLSAGFIDPAWHGSKLTMELFNANPNPIPIYKGLRLGQIIFTRCDAQPIKAYDERGRYNGDNGVQESKG
jgi:dCTP deaminase